MHGAQSYGQLSAALPTLSDKVLSERLAQLHERGLVERHRQVGFPSRTTYTLTDAGRHLRPLLVTLYETGQRLQMPTGAGPISGH